MPRAKKDEATTVETTQALAEPVKTVEDFQREVMEVGFKICEDYREGRVRPDAPLVNALTELYKAIKG